MVLVVYGVYRCLLLCVWFNVVWLRLVLCVVCWVLMIFRKFRVWFSVWFDFDLYCGFYVGGLV